MEILTLPMNKPRGGRNIESVNKAETRNLVHTRSIRDHFKTINMPPKKSPAVDVNADTLHEILTKLDGLTKEVSEVKRAIPNIQLIVKEVVAEEIKMQEKQWIEERRSLVQRLVNIEKNDEYRHKQEIKNNIVISGFEPSTNHLGNEIQTMLEEKLSVHVDIFQVRRIKVNGKRDLLIAKLANQDQKQSVMDNKKKLKGTKLYISHDRTLKERAIQRTISQLANEEKAKGSNVKIGFMKITIDGTTKVWREGQGLIPERQQENPAQLPFRPSINEVH